jgi:glycerol-3-phosphate acyltransferase PlsY
MHPFLNALAIILLSYLIGSIPFGWIIVKIFTGRDVRKIESGRTGGTNVMRAAGVLAGMLTAILDITKGWVSVQLVHGLLPPDVWFFYWVEIAAPLAAILGHNYSIYMLEVHETTGKLRLRGGAGGATSLGGAVGLWPPALLIILPLAFLVYIFVGYASVTTMSIAGFATLVFLFKTIQSHGAFPWQYVFYGLAAEAMLVWALRPNIKRLIEGNERIHGVRVWLKKRAEQRSAAGREKS